MKKYLFATDGSDPSVSALDYLIEDADESDEVTLVHVIPNPSEGFLGNDYDPNIAESKLREAADEVTNKAEEQLSQAGFKSDAIILMGHAGEEICGLAEDMDVDTIVMGRKGTGALSEVLLGSVSQYVVHHAPCAVTLVPSD